MSSSAICTVSLVHQVRCLLQSAVACVSQDDTITGRHCCLWCLVTSSQLKNPPSSVKLRTTDSIIGENSRFKAAGGDFKKAKDFHNCVREPFFRNIPLNQVRTIIAS